MGSTTQRQKTQLTASSPGPKVARCPGTLTLKHYWLDFPHLARKRITDQCHNRGKAENTTKKTENGMRTKQRRSTKKADSLTRRLINLMLVYSTFFLRGRPHHVCEREVAAVRATKEEEGTILCNKFNAQVKSIDL